MPPLRPHAVALWLVACFGAGGLAQVPEPSVQPPAPHGDPLAGESHANAGTIHIEQAKPDTYLLPDEDGRLQPMLGWTFEDFVRVWKSRDSATAEVDEPEVTLERLTCTGEMENEEFVRMQVQIAMRLARDGRSAVPLGFPTGILTDYTTDPGVETAYLQFDEELGEHVLWISGDTGDACTVRIGLLLPVTHRGTQRVLKFHPPRAAISELTLTLAESGILAESLSTGTHVTSSPVGDDTVVTARGLTGSTEIAWRTIRHAPEDARSLVAESDVSTRAEPTAIWTDVSLTVQDLNGALDRFLIRLPAGDELVSHEVDFASLHRVESDERTTDNGDAAEGEVYEVRLAEPQQAPLHLMLTLERPLPLQENEDPVVIRGVEVLGAVRQQGRVHLIVSDDLRVRWQEGTGVRQITTPSDAPNAGDITASFQFDTHDWQLPLVLALRPTEISVEPHYQLEIGRENVRLTAKFRYSVRGTKQFDLRYALGQWQLADDPQGPESTISADNAYVDAAGTMYLPLANPAEGTFETTLVLALSDTAASGRLQFRLPEPLDGRLQEGELIVSTDRSLEVIPQVDALIGLRPATRSMPTAAPPEPLDRSLHRYDVTSLPAEYAVAVRPRTRVVQNDTTIQVNVHKDDLEIDQRIRLDVRHLPLSEVVLQMPAIMAHSPSLKLELNGRPVPAAWDDPPDSTATGDRIARVVLEQPHLGELTIRVGLQLPWPSSSGPTEAITQAVVPIAIPQADAHRYSASLTNYTTDLQVQLHRAGTSRADESLPGYPSVGPGDGTRIDLTSPGDGLTLSARPVATTAEQALVVERTWVKSIVGGNAVQTSTAMRFVPTSGEIVLHLGAGGSANLEDVLLNRQPASFHISDDEVIIDADDLPLDVPCVLEVVQQGALDDQVDGNLRVVPPRVANARGHRLVYWQLVIPRGWHAYTVSDDLVSASPWRRDGIYWGRTPALSQADLEKLMDVPPEQPPGAAFNQLLYSGVDLPPVLEATLVRRSLVVLVTSGVILAVALAVLYIPALQRKSLFVAAVIVLAIAGAMYPDLAPFLLQAGALGIVLTLMAVFLKRLAAQWQAVPARPSMDTSIFRRETPSPIGPVASASSSEATSSARTLVPSLSDPGVQR